MANDKIRIFDCGSGRPFQNKTSVAVKIGFHFAVAVIYAVDDGFYSIRRVICDFHRAACRAERHNAFKPDLRLCVEFRRSRKAENIRVVECAVSVAVKIAVYVFNKRVLRKKVQSGNVVCAVSVAMNIVYKVCKIHCHRVERLDFAANVDIAQFNKRTERSA